MHGVEEKKCEERETQHRAAIGRDKPAHTIISSFQTHTRKKRFAFKILGPKATPSLHTCKAAGSQLTRIIIENTLFQSWRVTLCCTVLEIKATCGYTVTVQGVSTGSYPRTAERAG